MKTRLSLRFESRIEAGRCGLVRACVRRAGGDWMYGEWRNSPVKCLPDLRRMREAAWEESAGQPPETRP